MNNFLPIIIDLLLTIALYGLGPFLFAKLRKRPVSRGKVITFSVVYSFLIWLGINVLLVFYTGAKVSSGGAALLWGTAFYHVLKKHLVKTGRLSAPPAAPQERYQQQETDMGKFVVDSEKRISENTSEEPMPEILTAPVHQEDATQAAPPSQKESGGKRAFPVSTIILATLSAVCAALVVCVCVLGYLVNDRTVTVETLTAENTRLEEENALLMDRFATARDARNELKKEKEELETRLASADEFGFKMYAQLDRIGFIVEDSDYYHNFTCEIYTDADEYWAHNIEVCEFLGYSKCPICWH